MRLIDADVLEQKALKEPDIVLCGEEYISVFSIHNATTVDAAPVVNGEWIFRSIFGEDPYECSVCGNSVNVHGYSYCPHCSAKMDKEDKHNG